MATPSAQAGVLPGTGDSTTVMNSPITGQKEPDKIKITTISPCDGETVDLEKNKFKITFSEPGISKGPNIDRIYVNVGKGRVLEKSIESGSPTLTLSLWVKYRSAFTLDIPEGAVSSSTNNINQAQSFTFRSRESDLSFDIISTKPSNGQENVSLNSKARITFNEIGLEAGANFGSISIDMLHILRKSNLKIAVKQLFFILQG
jgi:hypothetical protein